MSQGDKTSPAAERDGLHCVYGRCQGPPNGPNMMCNPGCSFTMRAIDPIEMWKRSLVSHHTIPTKTPPLSRLAAEELASRILLSLGIGPISDADFVRCAGMADIIVGELVGAGVAV